MLRFHIFSCRYCANTTPKRRNFVLFSNSAGIVWTGRAVVYILNIQEYRRYIVDEFETLSFSDLYQFVRNVLSATDEFNCIFRALRNLLFHNFPIRIAQAPPPPPPMLSLRLDPKNCFSVPRHANELHRE